MTFAERWLAVAVLGPALGFAPSALGAEPAECRTVTERPLTDLRVVLTTDVRRTIAIDVAEGEVLCVNADSLDVVAAGSPSDTLRVELQRMARRGRVRDEATALSVRAPQAQSVSFRVALSAGASNDVVPLADYSLGPGEETFRTWPLSDRVVHHVLLSDFVTVTRPVPPPRPRPNFFGISIVSSVHVSRLDELNDELARNGFGRVSNVQPYLGLAFDGGIGRVRGSLDFEGGLSRPGDAPEVGLRSVLIALHAGYVVYRGGPFALFPMIGISGGDVHLTIDSRHPALFPSVFASTLGTEDIRKNLGNVFFSLGSDFRIPLSDGSFSRGGLIIGARAGYGIQFAEWSWVRGTPSSPPLAGGPSVDASGPYFRLGLGWYEE